MKELSSAVGTAAWRRILLSLACILAALLPLLLFGPSGEVGETDAAEAAGALNTGRGLTVLVLPGLLLLAGWILAISFLILDTWARWFWVAVLVLAAVLAATLGTGGVVFATFVSGFVLTYRRYRPWRHITARKRALGFGLGVIAVVILVLERGLLNYEISSGAQHLVDLGRWSLFSLGGFWLWSLFHLALGMRLHFLRLRPKLAVSAVLIGFVPLALMVVLGLSITYFGLGGARASRVGNILESWRETTAGGASLSGAPFDTTFAWPDGETSLMDDQATVIPAPEWTGELSRMLAYALAQDVRDTVSQDAGAAAAPTPAATDTTNWFLAGGEVWLMRWQDVGTPEARTRAWKLGHRPLQSLSGLLKTGVRLTNNVGRQRDGELVIGDGDDVAQQGFTGLQASYRDVSDDPAFWDKFRYFGGTFVGVLVMGEREVDGRSLFIKLQVRWEDLKNEFISGEDNLNAVVVVALALMAGLFLAIEVFALFFGIRISEGIVTAVHSLHRGTQALAAGDLDTVIEIPNEDEFGDLADSFNEMTVAIRKGREDALARDRLVRELETAREIQERLLPAEEPHLTGFEVTGASIPSREIGGDYFDFLVQGADSIGVAIGDVSGKGMPAALLMSNLQASLHGQIIHPSSVSEVVERVNDLLVKSTDSHMFATFFYGLLDTRTAQFTCTNAGHNPPLLLRNDGQIELLTTGGLLLGMLREQPYRQATVELAPGEVVVLYTDGITEAVGPSADENDPDAMFGEEALEQVIRASSHLPAIGIKEAILDAVANHTSGVVQSDDITLVVIRRQG